MYYSSHVSVYPPSPLPPTLSLCHITTRHFSRCPTTFLSSHIFSFACCSRAIKLLKKKKTTITLIFPTHNVEHTNTIATVCECVLLRYFYHCSDTVFTICYTRFIIIFPFTALELETTNEKR